MSQALWLAGTPQQRDNGGIPANVFSMNLADRIKLSKGVRRLPMAYTMSGQRCLSHAASSCLHVHIGAGKMRWTILSNGWYHCHSAESLAG